MSITPPAPLTLAALRPGASARIVSLRAANGTLQRLMEMGLVEGETLRVLRVAPLGDPIALRVHGYVLSLRKEDAAQVEVAPCD